MSIWRPARNRSQAWKKNRRAKTKHRPQLSLERLEERTQLTVLFTPVYGAETLQQTPNGNYNFQTLSSPQVQLIFWGPNWTSSQVSTLSADALNIINSHYLNGLTEYGSNGFANFHTAWTDTSAVTGTSTANIQAEIANAINNPASPIIGPASNDTQLTSPIYAVITDPQDSPGNGGWNAPGTFAYPNTPTKIPINMIYVGTSAGPNEYTFGLTFSHEMAEDMSDPTGNTNGVQLNPPAGIPTNLLSPGGNQIGDYEPEPNNQPHYAYRLGGSGGVIVQPYWSNANSAYIVTDGNSQTITATAVWSTDNTQNPPVANFSGTYKLTIGPIDGTISLNETSSGLQINLNGQSFFFDPGNIVGITINLGPTAATVNVEGTVFGDPVTINEGDGTDTVNISPSAQILDNIQGDVTVNGGSFGTDTLNVSDASDQSSRILDIFNSSVSRSASATIHYNLQNDINITGGSGNNTYNVINTQSGAFATTTLHTGEGADTVNILATGASSTLDVIGDGTINNVAVNIGNAGSVQSIQGTVNLWNPFSYNAVTVDDSADGTGRTTTLNTYTPAGDTNWGSISGLAPANINYKYGDTLSVTINTGNGSGNVVNVLATGVSTSLVGANATLVNIGSNAPSLGGTLANIAGPVNISSTSVGSTVVVDDSGDSTARTATITASSITGLSPAAINYTASGVPSLTIHGGDGGNTFNVLSTSTTTNLVLSGGNTVNVGNAGSVQGIAGALNIENPPSFTTITVDDSADTTARAVTLSTLGANSSDSDGNSDLWGQIAGLAPAHINYEYVDTTNLMVNGGSGGNTFNVQATAALGGGGTTILNTGAGNDTVNVGNTSNALDNILGSLTVNGQAGSNTMNVNDQGNSGANTYTVTSSSANRAGVAAITYSGLASLILNGSAGGSTYNLESTAVGTSTTINAGSGNNVFSITPATQNFSNVAGALIVNGGGADSLTVNDQVDAVADTYTIASGSVQRTGSASVTYTGIASLAVNGGSGGDTFNINSTAAGTPVTINGGTGNDIFNLAPSSDQLDNIQGAVTIADSGGSNAVNLDDQNKSGAQTYTVTAGTISRAGFAGLTFGSMQVLVLNGGAGADVYNIQSTSAATTVNGGAANDTFNVGHTGVLDGILGNLTVNGNLGTNTLNVDDHGNAVGQSFTLSSTALTRSGGVSITYGTIKTVNIKAGGNDLLTVLTPVPTVAINFDAGGGNNTMTGPNVANTWTVTAANHGTLGKIAFSNVENLIGGTGNDTFKFVGAGANISGNLSGGGGADKLDYSANGGGAISVNLQTGVATDIGGTFSGISSLVGSSNLGNTLTAANATNLWNISGPNLGRVNAFSFSKIENLVGGTGLDTFKFSSAGKETSISGGGAPASQGDWLDYSSFTALNAVNVNLLLGTASNISGSISGIENVIGGAGADVLTGDNNGNILIEHGGAGTINGGASRSLLISGTGAATVNGGSGGDILIGGKTSYDTTATGHLNLMAILAEWQSADSYAVRTDEIADGTIPGHLGIKLAVGSTVTLNPGTTAEHLNAFPSATDLDWFFTSSPTQHSFPEPGEVVNNAS